MTGLEAATCCARLHIGKKHSRVFSIYLHVQLTTTVNK